MNDISNLGKPVAIDLSGVMKIIHKSGLEKAVYDELHSWIMCQLTIENNRKRHYKSTINAISKIANQNPNHRNAIEGIIELCNEDGEE